jgi:N-methylhydantoinase B
MPASVDPVTFQIIRHKLLRILEEGVAALKNVSGSPQTNEAHDLMVGLYKADGSLMVGGAGYAEMMATASEAVKHIIKSFSEDPGIYEDDAYFFNDPYTAAFHAPDVYLISPIHFHGSLMGFVATFVHVNDIGAIDPGGFCPSARNCYQEGFQTQGLKIIERGKPRRDVLETFFYQVRDSGITTLDIKSQLAANHVAKERMHNLYTQYGTEAIGAVSNMLIEQSEKLFRGRLRELPHGQWQARQYLDFANGDVLKLQVMMTNDGDSLTFDFTGTDPQSALGVNCAYWATWGSLFAAILPVLAWDMIWNDGALRPVRLIAREGSCVNCTRPGPMSIATVGNVQLINNLSAYLIGKMLSASDKYRDRAMAIWRGSHAAAHLHGLTSEGQPFVVFTTDSFSGAGGARSFADGVDLGGDLANLISRIANVELHELNAPVRYLYRRVVPDSGGPGKWRGGLSHEFAVTAHDAREMAALTFGKGVCAPVAYGLCGGYAGSHIAYHLFHDANSAELPDGLDTTTGSAREDCQWGEYPLKTGDALYIRNVGGGGYGDPLEREPAAVLADVQLGAVSHAMALEIYGVVLTESGEEVDEGATRARRLAIREARLGKPPATAQRADVAPTGKRINEYLQVKGEEVQCAYCGASISPQGKHWKDVVPHRRLPTTAGGPNRDGGDRFQLCQFYCSSCATLLETEVLRKGEAVTHDRISHWPEAGG